MVDHLDVVSSLLFDACEVIDRSAAPSLPPTPPTPTPPTPPVLPPAPKRVVAAGCVVPTVRNLPLTAARRAITGARCGVGSVRKAYSKKVKKGRVISQTPAAGRRLPRGSRVGLVISRGRRP